MPADYYETDEPIRRRKKRGTSKQTLFFIVVGLLVAVVMAFMIYDRAERYAAKKRIEVIRQELPSLVDEYVSLGRALGVYDVEVKLIDLGDGDDGSKKLPAKKPPADPAKVKRRAELEVRIDKLEQELEKLLRDHPEFRR